VLDGLLDGSKRIFSFRKRENIPIRPLDPEDVPAVVAQAVNSKLGYAALSGTYYLRREEKINVQVTAALRTALP
jgi:hypothetical protein